MDSCKLGWPPNHFQSACHPRKDHRNLVANLAQNLPCLPVADCGREMQKNLGEKNKWKNGT